MDREIVVPDSFQFTEQNPVDFFSLMMSLTLDIQNAPYIIAFLPIIWGMFTIMSGTGAINAGPANAVRAMRGKELLMIPVIMTVFGLGTNAPGDVAGTDAMEKAYEMGRWL